MIMSMFSQYLIPTVLAVLALNGLVIVWYRHKYKQLMAQYESEKHEALKKQVQDGVELDKALNAHDGQSEIELEAIKNGGFSNGIDLK